MSAHRTMPKASAAARRTLTRSGAGLWAPADWIARAARAAMRIVLTRIPLLSRGGVAAPSIECCEATVDGADGVVLVNRLIFLTSTTPTPPRLRLRAIALALRGLRRGLVLERVINDAPSSRRDLNLVRCKVAIRAAWR